MKHLPERHYVQAWSFEKVIGIMKNVENRM
jgi:hypothetical protein